MLLKLENMLAKIENMLIVSNWHVLLIVLETSIYYFKLSLFKRFLIASQWFIFKICEKSFATNK